MNFFLDNENINLHYHELTCAYSGHSDRNLKSFSEYKPESFLVSEKRKGTPLLFFRDLPYDSWIEDMFLDQFNKLQFSQEKIKNLYNASLQNLNFLLEWKCNNKKLEDQIYNQEFVDIIRKVIQFTIYGCFSNEIHTAQQFNSLADNIMSYVIKTVDNSNYSLKYLFKLSIASGLSGLDLKGAPSASSSYVNMGIPMKQYLYRNPSIAAREYLVKLIEITENTQLEIFDWEKLELYLSKNQKLVWLTDDYIESYFDLLFIQKALDIFNQLNIEVIPKNGRFGNDLSNDDLQRIIKLPMFENLYKYKLNGRFSINMFGPKMSAANIEKLSDQCIKSMIEADFVILKGCRIFEMLQGGINIESFSAFIVSRTLSEIVTGLNSYDNPIVLLYLSKGEHGFFGVNLHNAKQIILSDGRTILTTTSTIYDHYIRRQIVGEQNILNEIKNLKKIKSNYIGNKIPINNEIKALELKLKK